MTTGAKSHYLVDKIIDHVLRNTAYTSPGATVYAALFDSTAVRSDLETDPYTTAREIPNLYSYARVAIAGTGAWDAPVNGVTANTSALTFPTASGGNWGTVRWIALMDNATHGSGNVLYFAQLDADVTINDGDTFQIDAGDLDLTED